MESNMPNAQTARPPVRLSAVVIDMTPTWEESAAMLHMLAARGDSKGQATALEEMRRMGRLADMAMVMTGGHRRDDAPAPAPMPDLIRAAVAFLQSVKGDDMAAAMLESPVETARAAEMLRAAPAVAEAL
jgi:hypothetical protein